MYNYKLFRKFENGKTKIFLRKIIGDYYGFIKTRKAYGELQVLMTTDISFEVIKEMSKNHSVKISFSEDFDSSEHSHVLKRVVDLVNEDSENFSILEFILNSIGGESALSINHSDLCGKENSFRLKSNGVVIFNEKPDDEIKERISSLVESQFNN